MSIGDYLILVQNLFLFVLVICPAWILCKGKKKTASSPSVCKPGTSCESLQVKSAIRPPITDQSPSMMGAVKDDAKKEDSKAAEAKTNNDKKEGTAGGAEGDAGKEKDKKPGEPNFPKFEMPTESKKKKKAEIHEKDKKEKMKSGFYQEKSDEDDTLEKVDSLRVEQSDKTKRSQKKKK